MESKKKYELKRKRSVVISWFTEFPGLVHESLQEATEAASTSFDDTRKLLCGTCLKYPLNADKECKLKAMQLIY